MLVNQALLSVILVNLVKDLFQTLRKLIKMPTLSRENLLALKVAGSWVSLMGMV